MAGTIDQLRCATGTASPALSYATLAVTVSGRAPHRWCLAWGLRRLARLPRPVPEGLDRHRPAQRHQDRRHHRNAQDRRPGGGEIRSRIAPISGLATSPRSTLSLRWRPTPRWRTSTPTGGQFVRRCHAGQGRQGAGPTGHGHGVEPDMVVIEKYRQGPVGCVR